ncbi:MAG: sugar transferase [bacterium]
MTRNIQPKSQRKVTPRGPFWKFLAVDCAVFFIALGISFILYFRELREDNILIYEQLILLLICMRIFALSFFRLYNFSRPYTAFDLIYFTLGAMILAHGAETLSILYLGNYYEYQISRLILFLNFIFSWIGHASWRILYLKRRRRWAYDRTNILIVGAGQLGESIFKDIHQFSRLGHHVVGLVDDDIEHKVNGEVVLGRLKDLPRLVRKHDVDEIIVTSRKANRQELLEIISRSQRTGCKVRLLPELYEVTIGQVEIEQVAGVPLITVNPEPGTDLGRFTKRAVDITASLLGLILLSPLLLLITLLIRWTSAGPALYRQRRVGQRGREFTLYKFRTMYHDAEKQTGPVLSCEDDPRVTSIGRFLRCWHLDELPQLINVLKGEMSLVGPRPERPLFAKKFAARIPAYRLREAVRPGMTGLAQIHGFYHSPVEHKLRYDLAYINNMSLLLDLKILFLTIQSTFSSQSEPL